MIVYGDRSIEATLSSVIDALELRVARVERTRHVPRARELALDVLLETGALCQAVQDHAFEARGSDELSDECTLVLTLATLAARLSDDPQRGDFDTLAALLRAARGVAPEWLSMRVPEGFAFYAVYPALYAAAAASLRDEQRPVQVIGIRSIGTTLGAVVAAACGSTRLPWTVRPVGPPYQRELRIGPRLEAALLEGDSTLYAIVDEGPGRSGSSFASVVDWLAQRGVSEDRIVMFPSHAHGPGPSASQRTRSVFARVAQRSVELDGWLLSGPRPQLARWFEDATGSSAKRIEDLSGGTWRAHAFSPSSELPACDVQQERRKLLVDDGAQRWLLRYLGLGAAQVSLRARAERLVTSGFVPAITTYTHGFTIGPWLEQARPAGFERVDRAHFVDHVARYLAFVSRTFPVASGQGGARPKQLLDAARHNVRLGLGDAWSASLQRFEAELPALERAWTPVMGDAKLDAHEWLITPEGDVFKADALDHHAGHDFVGCQDPHWDVVGAMLELGLDEAELERVIAVLHDAGVQVRRAALPFYAACYLGFRAGQAHLSASTLESASPDDAVRMRAREQRYWDALRTRLSATA